jgi:serine/threonine protein kinase
MDSENEILKEYDIENEYAINNLSNYFSIYFSHGKSKFNKEKHCLIEKIELDNNNIKEYEIKQIIKEIILYKKLKGIFYFPKLINIFKSENNKSIYFISEGDNINLDMLIKSNIFDLTKQKDLIKYIIYQIAYSLYIFHSNNFIHHNIKPLNILINEKGVIAIYNFLSVIYKGEKSIYYTPQYAAPEIFFQESNVDEKYDMWALGVLIIELYLKKTNYFSSKNKEEENKNINQLDIIFSKFQIEDNKIEDSKMLYKNILNEKIKAEFEIKELSKKINDPDAIELIKNLIVINPKKRLSAKQVLMSNYLKEYFGLDSLEIKPINFSLDFVENSKNIKDKSNSIQIIDDVFNYVKI